MNHGGTCIFQLATPSMILKHKWYINFLLCGHLKIQIFVVKVKEFLNVEIVLVFVWALLPNWPRFYLSRFQKNNISSNSRKNKKRILTTIMKLVYSLPSIPDNTDVWINTYHAVIMKDKSQMEGKFVSTSNLPSANLIWTIITA